MSKFVRNSLLVVLNIALAFSAALGQEEPARPGILEDVGLDQKLGSQVPLDLEFLDEGGNAVRLGNYFQKKPVILTLVYYECPMLCTLVLNGTLRAMRALEFSAGNEFEVVTVSINPNETPELATTKKASYLKNYDRAGTEGGWHFLTGKETAIKPLADAVGFRYAYDTKSGEFAHASGIMILTPEGKVARYFYGVEYSPRDIRLGLIEATQEKIGNPVDQLLLFCYHYDPLTGKYSFAVHSVLRVAGALTILAIAFLLIALLRKERRGEKAAGVQA